MISHVYTGFLVEPEQLENQTYLRLFDPRGSPRWKGYSGGYASNSFFDLPDTNVNQHSRIGLLTIQTVRCFVSLSGPVVDEWLSRSTLSLMANNQRVMEIPLLPLVREPFKLNFEMFRDGYEYDILGEITCRDHAANLRLSKHLRGLSFEDLRAHFPALAPAIDDQEAALDSARRLGTDLAPEEKHRMWGWIFLSGEQAVR